MKIKIVVMLITVSCLCALTALAIEGAKDGADTDCKDINTGVATAGGTVGSGSGSSGSGTATGR